MFGTQVHRDCWDQLQSLVSPQDTLNVSQQKVSSHSFSQQLLSSQFCIWSLTVTLRVWEPPTLTTSDKLPSAVLHFTSIFITSLICRHQQQTESRLFWWQQSHCGLEEPWPVHYDIKLMFTIRATCAARPSPPEPKLFILGPHTDLIFSLPMKRPPWPPQEEDVFIPTSQSDAQQHDTQGCGVKQTWWNTLNHLEVFSPPVSVRLNPWQLKDVRLTGAQPLQHFTCLKLQPGEEDKDTFITDAASLPFTVGLWVWSMKYAAATNIWQGQRFEPSWVTEQTAVWLHHSEWRRKPGSPKSGSSECHIQCCHSYLEKVIQLL